MEMKWSEKAKENHIIESAMEGWILQLLVNELPQLATSIQITSTKQPK